MKKKLSEAQIVFTLRQPSAMGFGDTFLTRGKPGQLLTCYGDPEPNG